MTDPREVVTEMTEGASIGGMLSSVFDNPRPEEEEEVTAPRGNILDEESFEPIPTEGMRVSEPTSEDIAEHPELEYNSKEIRDIIKTLDPGQRQQFKEYEQYFLSRYRKTGNMVPLHLEIRKIVRSMCNRIPSATQDQIVEARAQLLAEERMRELCKELRIPCPLPQSAERPPMQHPIDEGLLGATAPPMTTSTERMDIETSEQPSTSATDGTTVTVKTEDIKPPRRMATQYLGDAMLRAMENTGDEDCTVLRIKRGPDPFYDLTKDDEELDATMGLIPEDIISEYEVEEDDLSYVSVESRHAVDHEEAKKLLTKLADQKAKEANSIQELAALTGELDREQLYDTVQGVIKVEREMPEFNMVTDEYDYEATRLILASGTRMRQVYDYNMGHRGKIESLQALADRFCVSKSRLYEMLRGQKISRKGSMKEPKLLLDQEEDKQLPTEQEALERVRTQQGEEQ